MSNADFFTRNRASIYDRVGGVFVVSGNTLMQRGNDMAFQFEQESNFWWLTGISEANWKLVLTESRSYLVAPHLEEAYVTFNGGLSPSQALKVSGADTVLSEQEYQELLSQLAKKHQEIYTIFEDSSVARGEFILNPAQGKLQRQLKRQFKEVIDCRSELARLRALKQPEEIKCMKAAIATTIDGFRQVKDALSELTHEYEAEAILNKAFRSTGSGGHAYDPIVASGKNACTLHYNTNNDPLKSGTLLLIDAGAQVNGYAADVTRTYAVGTPTKRQIEVHAAVEHAHKSIIELIKPGLAFKEYQLKSNEIMKDALQKVGLLTDRDNEKTYRKYFPHAISHGLGLDVHESLGGFGEFKPGMILTVEPGIYIPEEGIGVRIEDDILVTASGYENLSGGLSTSL